MEPVVVDADAAIKRLREWLQSMDLDDLAIALSELGEYENQKVVIRSGDWESFAYINGKIVPQNRRRG